MLDVGCSSGYLARPLVGARASRVVGIELDPRRPPRRATWCDDGARRRRRDDGAPASRPARSTSSSAATSSSTSATRGRTGTPAPAPARRRPPRPDDAERRQLGDAALASRRALAVHGSRASSTGRTRISSRARLSSRRSRPRATRRRARPHRARCRVLGHAFRRARRARDRAALRPVAPRLPVPPRCDATVISVVIPVKDGGADLVRCLDGDRRAGGRRRGRGRRRRLRLDRREPRARARAARVVHEIPPSEFGHGRTRNLGVSLASGDVVVFTSQDAVADDERWLATPRRRRALGTRGRRRVRPPAAARRGATARALLPRLPLRARRRASSARGRRRSSRSRRRSSRTSTPRSHAGARAIPVPRRPDDERGPGVVATRAPRGLSLVYEPRAAVRHRMRTRSARRSGASSTRVSRPSTRTSRATRRAPRCAGPGLATPARSSRGSGARAAALDPVHRRLRARQVRRTPARATTRAPAALARVEAERAPGARPPLPAALEADAPATSEPQRGSGSRTTMRPSFATTVVPSSVASSAGAQSGSATA